MGRTLLLDTTLSDGLGAAELNLTALDQARVALRLDELGIDFLEVDPHGGAAGFFREVGRSPPRHARLLSRVALPAGDPARDRALRAALRSAAAGVILDAEVPDAARIAPAVRDVVGAGRLVVVRWEDFFASWLKAPVKALAAVTAAVRAGAAWVILRDSSAAATPRQVGAAVAAARKLAGDRIGVGAANDRGLALAAVIEGVGRGAGLAEGGINGYGPRCGVADLVQVAANLSLGKRAALSPERLRLLSPAAHFVAELANHQLEARAPFVGASAFAAGPGSVPLAARALGAHPAPAVQDRKGHSLLAKVARARGARGVEARQVLARLHALELRGFRFEGAEASFELALRRLTAPTKPYFEVVAYRCICERHGGEVHAEATCQVRVGEQFVHTAASGSGPIHALDLALRTGLDRFYPSLRDTRLLDYKVRLLPSSRGTAATARVLAQTGDGRDRWGTGGVSEDLIDASFGAIVDAILWKLHKDGVRPLG